MGQSNLSGPLRSNAGFQAGADGSQIQAVYKASGSVTVPAIAAGAESDQTITVTGAQDGDAVSVSPPNAAAEAGLSWSAWVSAANTVSIRLQNNSASPLSGSTANWSALVTR